MRVLLSAFIQDDLDEIAAWIAKDNPRRAVSFLREIRAEIQRIALGPMHYQLRPEIGVDARLAVVGNYVIMFSIDGDTVRIERVVYGGRDLPPLFQ